MGARGRTVGGLYIAASVGRYCIDRKDTVSPTEGYNEAGWGRGRSAGASSSACEMASADSDELRCLSAADEEPVSVVRNRRKPPVQPSRALGTNSQILTQIANMIDGFPCYAASCKVWFRADTSVLRAMPGSPHSFICL